MADSKIKRKVLRISILGDSSTGKTSIINRFLGNEFSLEMISNIGIDKQELLRKMKDGNDMKIILWDTAGQERFHSISSSTIKNSQGIIVCFSLIDVDSFKNVVEWLETIREESAKIPVVLFGNKCDLADQRKISKEEAESFAKKNDIPYFETSAKDNINLEEGLDKIIEDAYAKSGKESGMKLKPNVENTQKKKCCK
jgi:small GTP-binding protein